MASIYNEHYNLNSSAVICKINQIVLCLHVQTIDVRACIAGMYVFGNNFHCVVITE